MNKIYVLIIILLSFSILSSIGLFLYINKYKTELMGIGSDGEREYDCRFYYFSSNFHSIDVFMNKSFFKAFLGYKLSYREVATKDGDIAKETVNNFKTLNKYSSKVIGITQKTASGDSGCVVLYADGKIIGSAIFKNNSITSIPTIAH